MGAVLFAVLLGAPSSVVHGQEARARAPDVASGGVVRSGDGWLIDGRGRVLLPRGFDYGPCASDRLSRVASCVDPALVAASGFTVVRIPFSMSALEPRPGLIDRRYLDDYVRLVDDFGRHGVFVIVAAAQDGYGPPPLGQLGMPPWMQDIGPVVPCGIGCPAGSSSVDRAVQTAFASFWANAPLPGGPYFADGRRISYLQDAYADMWHHVARTFAGEPHVLGYDLFDRPRGETTGFEAGALRAFYHKVTRAIRAVDPEHVTFSQPSITTGSSPAPIDVGARTTLVGTRNGALSWQASCGSFVGTECAAALVSAFTASDGYAAQLTTDAGPSMTPDDRRAFRELADAHMVPWLTAGSSDASVSSTAPARPYPYAVAGTPAAYGVDPSGTSFDLKYSTRSPSGATGHNPGDTLVHLPPSVYPNGYLVSATGARVLSPPDAEWLRLANRRHADTVNVSVRPA